ncbi:antigen [Sarotherodon galilaeus]
MEANKLKRDVEALIDNYIGQKLREDAFDPKGKGTFTALDDLAHYDLAISVALWWLEKKEGRHVLDREIIGATCSLGSAQYPNRLEREAMILSSFAGIIMSSLPVEEILTLYRCKPAASYPNQKSKGSIVYPITLSYHPFAMLGSYKVAHHSKKHNQKLKRWLSGQTKASAPPKQVSSLFSTSSQSFISDSSDVHQERTEHYEGSQESLHD